MGIIMKRFLSLIALLLCMVPTAFAMVPLDDDELSGVNGQALFMADKMAGTGSVASGTSGVSFYKMGLDVQLDLNMNIDRMELGRTGAGNTNVDLLANQVTLGCVANALGQCVSSESGTATQLRPFTLLRPYIQVAVLNDNNPALREVVGIRLGAQNANGPFGFGELLSFSGYLSAKSNIAMLGQNDIALTCGRDTYPCNGSGSNDGTPNPPDWSNGNLGSVNFKNYCVGNTGTYGGINCASATYAYKSFDLNNDEACFIGVCVAYRTLTVCFLNVGPNCTGRGQPNQIARTNLDTILNGKRQTQALIFGAQLGSLVNELTTHVRVADTSSSLGDDIINGILPAVRGSVATTIRNQLAGALGTTNANLDTYNIPYNVSNIHQLLINSSDFGLSFQKQVLRYPGYAGDATVGWAMYIPDAFTLNVSQPTTNFVRNIMSGAARYGNIIALPPLASSATSGGGGAVFDNCWGAATFC